MSASVVAEILKLPAEDRLHLVELLWESLNADAAGVPLSEAHRAAIDDALAEHLRNPDDVLSLEQVMSEARRAR